MGHVVSWAPWGGLVVLVAVVPRPPPNWPTITSEVSGTDAGKLFVKTMVRGPGGTVITTGDQLVATARKLASDDWKVQVTVPSVVVPEVFHVGAAPPLVPAVVTICTFWLVSTTS
jgi:hypothetical protein